MVIAKLIVYNIVKIVYLAGTVVLITDIINAEEVKDGKIK